MKALITKKIGSVDYHIHRPIFFVATFLLLALALVGLYQNDWSLEPKFYLTCNQKDGCVNGYYNSLACPGSPYEYTALCTREKLFYGESFGERPTFITRHINTLATVVILIALLLNTLLFNKDVVDMIKSFRGD